METTPHWKRIWRAVTGRSKNATADVVDAALEVAQDYLVKGITMYHSFTEDSFTKCLEKVDLKEYSELSKFIHHLSVVLVSCKENLISSLLIFVLPEKNLDACSTWPVFCNYLMFEHYGKMQDMGEIMNEMSGKTFVNKIWQFYTLERTYLLKILHYIVENHKNTSHKFHQQYAKFINNVTYKKLQQDLFKQFSHLLEEIPVNNLETVIDIKDQMERNSAEQLQVLLLILTTMKYEKFGIAEFLKIFKLFSDNTFALATHQQEIGKLSRPQMLESIQSVQFAIFVASFETFWFNQDEWYPYIDEIEKMTKAIFSCSNISIILLAWAALQSTLPDDLAKLIYEQHSHVYVTKALGNYVFLDMCQIVSNSLFQDSVAGLVAKTAIYKLFDVLCIQFEAHNVYVHEGAVTLLSRFLCTPELAYSWEDTEGIKAFYLYATKLFPHHFQALSVFMESFIRLNGDAKQIMQQLTRIQTYTGKYVSPEFNGPYIRNNMLIRTYKPFDNDLIVFSPGTRAFISEEHGETLMEIHGEWNYFKLLRHVVNHLFDHVEQEQKFEEGTLKMALTGYKLILEILKVDPDLAWENADINDLLQLALCLLSLSIKPSTKNLEVMKVCFEITIQIFKREPANVVRALIAIEFLPKLSNEDISSEDFNKSYLLSRATLIHYIEEELSHSQSCDLLILYIQLVNEAMKMDVYYAKLQLPSCMFLLVKVFPVFFKQLFTDDFKKRKVAADLVTLINHILKRSSSLSVEPNIIIYNCVMELFVNNKTFARSLLKIFECGNNKLQLLLITEMNWESGPFLIIVETVKRALECVLLILNFIKSQDPKKYRLFEEQLYWWEPVRCSSLKVISSYLNHTFDPEIPKIACKILTSFVKISSSPLLHSLQLDDYQLQSMFLERLRDSLDDQEMKVVVVKLVTACVHEQSGMTSGFFNTSPKGEHSDISMLSFLREYLKNIEKNPNTLLMPIQGAILDLFHELWKNNKHHLLKTITDQESFWVSFTSPLLKPNNVPIEILLQILEIVVLEMHYCKANINEKFTKGFKAIFENPKEFLNLWVDRLIALSHDDTLVSDTSHLPLCVAFLTIWKNFMLSVKLLNADYFEREWNQSVLVKRFLKGLLRYTEEPTNITLLTLWGELLLMFVNFPTMQDDAEKKEIFDCLTNIVDNLSKFYGVVDDRCRTVLLTVITIVVTNFKEFLVTNPSFILPFLTPLEGIFFYEYKNAFTEISHSEDHYRNWVLVLRILRTFLQFNTLSDYEYFFIHVRFVERMTEVLGLCVIHSLPVRMAKVTALLLVEFAESPLVQHFEYLNLLVISEHMLPPKQLILQTNRFPNGIIPEHLKNWWTIYLYIVRLNCTLLRRRKGYVSQHILEFVYIHQSVLADALLSATVVADSTNLELVTEVLRFIYTVLEYKQEWKLHDQTSYYRIMLTVKDVINASIGVILRPKCLIFVPNTPCSVKFRVQTEVPTQNLISITNSCLEIITWACKCFTRCNPPCINLLGIHKPTNFNIFVEYDFRVPPAVEENAQFLTFGSLLCALHFVCKVLSQMFFQDKEKSSESVTTPKSMGDASLVPTPSSATTPTPTSNVILSKPDVEQYFNVLILPSYTKETPESISVLHGFTVPEIMGLQAPWLIHLNPDILMFTLNALTTFLAGQAFLTVRDNSIERNLKRYVKRELCSELSLFYDFVLKYLGDKYLGPVEEESPLPSAAGDTRVMATPRRAHTKLKIKPRDKLPSKSGSEVKLVVDILRICADRHSGRRTEMTDIEDCYLLALVHWFRHVCRLVHYSKFDEFLSRWHAKSTYVMPHSTFVKNTSVHLSDEEDDMK